VVKDFFIYITRKIEIGMIRKVDDGCFICFSFVSALVPSGKVLNSFFSILIVKPAVE